MGVTGLWTVLQPCARPVKIETLNKKRLAIDASIWIYQFLKAVRDKEGNALRNSHVVGFFRRICKLLFFGIKPVFVFDGGAPLLKRETIGGRKARREGRREDAVRTAGKLLGVQMRRRAEEEERKRREERNEGRNRLDEPEEEDVLPENMVYVEELQMTPQERVKNRQFKKTDAYHLPALDTGLAEMGAPNDPRVMSQEELEEYARQFHTGEDVNVYDFSKIDFNGPFFMSLPASDRYNILNAARLRSRLRMGYSKDQLDTMFPDRMAFSRFQIERVKERNELTQRLMNINGMNGEDAMYGINGGGRVAGEKGKEYVLVKNDGVEGGWALGVVSNKGEGAENKPIDVDGFGKPATQEDDDDDWEDDGFEDIPIEGLNRLPKRPAAASFLDNDVKSNMVIKQREALYKARQKAARMGASESILDAEEADSLFVKQDDDLTHAEEEDMDGLFEDLKKSNMEEDADDLDRAIAMSLEQPENSRPAENSASSPTYKYAGPRIDQPLEFNQKNAKVGRDVAQSWNARARDANPKPFVDDSDAEDQDDPYLQAALEESKQEVPSLRDSSKTLRLNKPDNLAAPPAEPATLRKLPQQTSSNQSPVFDGPLPFESLNLGTSILGKRKKKASEDDAGGFEKPTEPKEKVAQPIPPWFSAPVGDATAKKTGLNGPQYDEDIPETVMRWTEDRRTLKKQETGEVIDLDPPKGGSDDIIEVGSSSDDGDLTMGNLSQISAEARVSKVIPSVASGPSQTVAEKGYGVAPSIDNESDTEKIIEWEESDLEGQAMEQNRRSSIIEPKSSKLQIQRSKSSTPDFENTELKDLRAKSPHDMALPSSNDAPIPSMVEGESTFEALPVDDEDLYSDPEDEDLLRQLAIEAEEHARFASTLNFKSQLQNAEDYETELRQLRNQQKKDRRDADEVSHIMITECQQLLKLFGLPYVTAPMEAEAQCAELVSLGLVDGIVTDDSDIFLFGGTRVYKNMFNQAKFVECYLSSDLEKEYSLDRHNLIRVAHLLGSDYTEGIPSVGPVTALEILSEFATLEDFAEWCTQIQTGQNLSAEDAVKPFRRKFKRSASKIFLPATFPDRRVDQAYLHPDVDRDPSVFAWGVPDLDALRSFLMATIGWTQERTDEVLVPVIKDMNRRENEGTQANITQFFGGSVGVGGRPSGAGSAFAPRRRTEGKSKRMESALGRLHQQAQHRTLGEDEEGERVGATGVDVHGGPSLSAAAEMNGTNTHSAAKVKTVTRKRPPPPDTSHSTSDDDMDESPTFPKPRKRGNTGTKGRTVGKRR